MKTKIIFSLMLIFFINSFISAQSDYEAVQNFKKQYKQIEESIKSVSSVDQCNTIGENISNLKNDFVGYKILFDKALYPENFESSFVKIENALESKKTDLTQISTLTTQVGTLQTQVVELNQQNEMLIKQINELKARSEKDEATIAQLNKLVAQLKGNINQRDLLVRDLVDSLLVEFTKLPQNLSKKEAQVIQSKINKGNLFYNIERTIADNIRFTKVTQLTADDFSQMKKQYRDFDKVWKQIGPRLSSVYLNKKQKKSEISQIDSLFVQWNDQLNNEIWKGLQKLFLEKNINLVPFNNADQFVNSVSAFITDEIKNLSVKSKEEPENIFHTFADSIYFKTVEKKWIPFLIENNMMTQAEKNIVDTKIEIWKKEFTPSYLYLGYIALGVIILFTVVFLYKKGRKLPMQSAKFNE